MINLLLAPAAHGKTQHALARIRVVRAEHPLTPIVVILPNHTQLAEFRRRFAVLGGALGVSLFTFYGLYAELLARAGQPYPELDDPAQARLIRALVDDLAERGVLTHFAPLRARPGFAGALREAIEELKRARVFPEDFAAATRASPEQSRRSLGPRLEELAEIYSAYQRWLQDKHWADPEGLGWLAAEALEKDKTLGRELRLLVVDGFDEFNPTQLAVLAHLATRAAETLITLTGDPQRQRLAHRRFHRAQQQLINVLKPEVMGQTESGGQRVAETLRHLEAHLFEPPTSNPAPLRFGGNCLQSPMANDSITFLEAQTRALESRAALRWIKQRLVADGLRLDEVAILARALDPYRAFLEETAREFGLPLRIVGGAPLAESPVVSALLALLALPVEGWKPRPLLAAWRSPYFDWPALGIDPAHAATLDAVARSGRVVEGLDQWREALRQFAAPPAREDVADEPESAAARPVTDTAARAAFETFVARVTSPSRASLPDFVVFVEDLIGDDPPLPGPRVGHAKETPGSLNVVARALAATETAARDIAALRAFKDILRGLVLSEALIREEKAEWEYTAFITALREAVESSISRPHSPPAEGVFTASVLDARGLSFRAVALLGLAEGEFPQAEREMPLLREADREALRARGVNLESRLRGDEVTFFYEAVTRTREHLLLCRPYLADDGQRWEPSAYWRQVWRLTGEPQPLTARPEDRLPPAQIASPAEWIEHGYDARAIARGAAVLQARLAAQASGPHEGELPELVPAIAARFPPDKSWSASRLEAYGTCGLYFYFAHALKLEPRAEPEEGYDVRALGSMYHAILERLYRDAPDPTGLDGLLSRLPKVARDVFVAAPADYGFRPTALWDQQQAELLRILRETVTALADKSEGWTPRYFEQRFGFGSPALVVHTPEGEVRLHGYIDRIDVDAEGRLRVVDYKASGAPISADDLKDGHRLQLPLYALAARDALNLGEVAAGLYWHIGKAKESSLKLEKFEGGVPGAFEAAKQHLAAHVAGIRAGRFQPKPPEGGCPSYCPATRFCWRYKPKGF